MQLNRRNLLALFGMSLVSSVAVAADEKAKKHEWAKKPDIPTDFNPEEFFVELMEKGEGVALPTNKEGQMTVRMVFDSQCPWCVWQFKEFLPFVNQINFIWYPVAVLNPWSELQGAAILSASSPYETFMEHEKHFKDPDFRGLDVRGKEYPFEKRQAVWNNSKVARRSGVRTVPFGVLQTREGKFVPLNEIKTADFAKLTGLTPEK